MEEGWEEEGWEEEGWEVGWEVGWEEGWEAGGGTVQGCHFRSACPTHLLPVKCRG